MTRHRLDPTPDTVVDVFDPDRAPVHEVAAGDTLVVRSLDASGYLAPQSSPGAREATMFAEPRGHCLTGPIAIAEATPGSVLAVHLVSMTPDPWGWTVAAALDNTLNRRLGVVPGDPEWLLWDIDVENGRATNQHGTGVAVAPFLGVTGIAPADRGEHSTIPPRAQGGGNIDCRELVAGSTLYLPVQVPGALLSLGDGHAAQGDGEVGGTAIECPMTTEVVVDVLPDRPVPGIHATTPAGRITFGFDADLNEATAEALSAMLVWLQLSYGVDRPTALALASTVVHMRVTQVANQVWGVHALLPHGALR